MNIWFLRRIDSNLGSINSFSTANNDLGIWDQFEIDMSWSFSTRNQNSTEGSTCWFQIWNQQFLNQQMDTKFYIQWFCNQQSKKRPRHNWLEWTAGSILNSWPWLAKALTGLKSIDRYWQLSLGRVCSLDKLKKIQYGYPDYCRENFNILWMSRSILICRGLEALSKTNFHMSENILVWRI